MSNQSQLIRRLAPNGALAVATALAYRGMFDADPYLHIPDYSDPVEEYFFSQSGSSPALIVLLATWFTARRIGRMAGNATRGATDGLGVVVLIAALSLVIWGAHVGASQMLPLSLAMLLAAIGLLLGGWLGLRQLAMPIVFLGLLGPPVPTPLLNAIIYPMQIWAAETATFLIRMSGQAVQNAGELVILPWAQFQVIESCAGLRSVQTLTMAAFVYGEVMNLSTRRRIGLIALAPILGLAINLGRVLLLVLTVENETEMDHAIQGIVMIILGVLALWGIDELMHSIQARAHKRRSETRPDQTEPDPTPSPPSNARFMGLVVGLLLAAAIATWIPRWNPTSLAAPSPHSIPLEIGDWSARGNKWALDEKFLGSTRFSSRVSRRYERRQEKIDLFVGTNERYRRTDGVVSRKTQIIHSGAHASRAFGPLREGAGHVQEGIVQSATGSAELVHHWHENTEGLLAESVRSALALDRGPFRRTAPARVYRLASPIGATSDALENARRRLLEFRDRLRSEWSTAPPG